MLSRCLIASLTAALILSTGCHHCRCTSYRRPLMRHHGSSCCEPAACCGYGAPAVPMPVPSGPPLPVPVTVTPPGHP